MAERPETGTRVTLLARLRSQPDNQVAWSEFVAHYGPVIRAWCRRWQLQEADAEDVTQNVLLRLAAKLPEFVYDRSKSFRAWLKTLTHHAWQDFLHRYVSPTAGTGRSSVQELLDSSPARQDLELRLETAFDQELVAIASARVRERVAPQTWEAFRLTAIEGLSGATAAERIPMQVGQVYVAKRRVHLLLQEELVRLDDMDGPQNAR
jgi:RNA polymerase sigma-70 factor (ECF subfamily)